MRPPAQSALCGSSSKSRTLGGQERNKAGLFIHLSSPACSWGGGDLLEWLARCNSAFSTGPNAPFRPSPNSTSSKKPARCARDVCHNLSCCGLCVTSLISDTASTIAAETDLYHSSLFRGTAVKELVLSKYSATSFLDNPAGAWTGLRRTVRATGCLIWFVLESGEGWGWAAPGTGVLRAAGPRSDGLWMVLGLVSGHAGNGPGRLDDTGPSPAAAEHEEAGALKKQSPWEIAGPWALPLWVWP